MPARRWAGAVSAIRCSPGTPRATKGDPREENGAALRAHLRSLLQTRAPFRRGEQGKASSSPAPAPTGFGRQQSGPKASLGTPWATPAWGLLERFFSLDGKFRAAELKPRGLYTSLVSSQKPNLLLAPWTVTARRHPQDGK